MANQTEFKVIVTYEDGQAKVKIEELTAAINKNSAASKQAASSTDELGNANKRLKEPLEGTIGALEKENAELLKQIKNQTTSTVEGAKLAKRYQQNSIEIQRMTAEMGLFNKVNQGMISNTGLAGATLTEFGRTISDAPYGIQGMANNMSQLSSLFTTFVSKTEGGVIPALKQLRKEFLGPLGIVIAIQAALAAWEWLSKNQKEAADSAKDARSEYIAMQSTLLYQVDILEDVNTSEKERSEIIANLKREIPSLKDEEIKYGESLDYVRQKIIDYTLAQANRAEMEKLQQENQELLVKRNRLAAVMAIEDADLRFEAFKKLQEEFHVFSEGDLEKLVTKGFNTYIEDLKGDELRKRYEKLTQDIFDESDKVLTKITELASSSTKELENSASESEKNLLGFLDKIYNDIEVQGSEQFEKRRIQARQEFDARKNEINEALADESKLKKGEREKLVQALLDIEASYQKELNLIRESEIEYIRDQDDKALKEKEKDLSDTAKEIIKWNKYVLDKERNEKRMAAAVSIKDKNKLQEELNKIDEDYYAKQKAKIQLLMDAGLIDTKVGLQMMEAFEKKITDLAVRRGLKSATKEDKELTTEEIVKNALNTANELVNALEQTFNAQYDAEISREEAKTEKLNNELRKRLNNEKLTAEQREAINNQIAANEAALQQRRDEIAEKNFKLQKAISISRTLISTYEMAANAYKALAGIPVVGPALGTAAAAAASIFGLNQVKAISETEFVPSAIATPNISAATSPAPTIQAPNFNVVGASNQNQLADAINAKLDKPIEAFVVSKNVKTALELDRNKIQAAGL